MARVRLRNLVNVRTTKRSMVNVNCGVLSKENSQGRGHGRAMLPCDTKLTKIGNKLWQNTIKSWSLLNTQCLLKT